MRGYRVGVYKKKSKKYTEKYPHSHSHHVSSHSHSHSLAHTQKKLKSKPHSKSPSLSMQPQKPQIIDLTHLYRSNLVHCNYTPTAKVYKASHLIAAEDSCDDDDDIKYNQPFSPSNNLNININESESSHESSNISHLTPAVSNTNNDGIDTRTPVEKELDRLADVETVKSFIVYECMMPKYFKKFIKNGFVSMYKIANELNEESLDKMNISSSWEKSIIFLNIKKYKQKIMHKS